MKPRTPTPLFRKKGGGSPYCLGIDPGASGGIALLRSRGGEVYLSSMPDSERGILEVITTYISVGRELSDNNLFCCIEQVGGWTGGRAGYAGNQAPGSAMFNFGWNYGLLRMALIANGLIDGETMFSVPPTRWQNGLGIKPRMTKARAKKLRTKKAGRVEEESKAQFKRRLKDVAISLFPREKITMNTCDALLIAEYCSLTYGVKNGSAKASKRDL